MTSGAAVAEESFKAIGKDGAKRDQRQHRQQGEGRQADGPAGQHDHRPVPEVERVGHRPQRQADGVAKEPPDAAGGLHQDEQKGRDRRYCHGGGQAPRLRQQQQPHHGQKQHQTQGAPQPRESQLAAQIPGAAAATVEEISPAARRQLPEMGRGEEKGPLGLPLEAQPHEQRQGDRHQQQADDLQPA